MSFASSWISRLSPTRTNTRLKQLASFWLVLFVIMLIGAGLRFYQLGANPQRFNQDEMLLGYDAWSIWQTGRDHHGAFMPVVFRAFNDYVPPVGTYIDVPFVGLFGLSETTARLPSALLGTATIVLVGLLGRRWFSPLAGLAAALFLCISPWHINYSRLAHPSALMPFFIALSLYTFSRGLDSVSAAKSTGGSTRSGYLWLALSSLSFALLAGTYPTMKLEVPLLILACIIASAGFLLRNYHAALFWLGLILLFGSPLLLEQLLHWDENQIRYNTMSLVSRQGWPPVFFHQYAQYFNPDALLFSGFTGGLQVLTEFVGEVFWLEGPLWIVGIIALARQDPNRRPNWPYRVGMLLALGLLFAPVASSLTTDPMHEIRAYGMVPFLELLSGYGAAYVWSGLSKFAPLALLVMTPTDHGTYVWRRVTVVQWRAVVAFGLVSVSVVLMLLFMSRFTSYFFNPPLTEVAQDREVYYNVGLRPVVEHVYALAGPCDVIWMQSTNQTYIYYLFLSQYPPEQFFTAPISEVNTYPINIAWFANVRFASPGEITDAPLPDSCHDVARNQYDLFMGDGTPPEGWEDVFVVKNDKQKLWQLAVKLPAIQ